MSRLSQYIVELSRIEVFAHVGYPLAERQTGQRIQISLQISVDPSAFRPDEQITSVLNYEHAFAIVQREAEVEVKMIETLAAHIGQALLDSDSRILNVTVRIEKPAVPLPGSLDFAAVDLRFERE